MIHTVYMVIVQNGYPSHTNSLHRVVHVQLNTRIHIHHYIVRINFYMQFSKQHS